MAKLNPDAVPFHRSPNSTPTEPFHQGSVAPSPPQQVAQPHPVYLPTYSHGAARRTGRLRPPRFAGRPNGTAGCHHQVADGRSLGDFKVPPMNKKTKHPLMPVKLEEGTTTIMMRNIPNRYTREMLIEFLDNHCLSENKKVANKDEGGGEGPVSAFDIVYLPIDFGTHLNKGYGFVNFTNPEGAWRFYQATNNMKWDFFQSNKVCDNVAARYQGKEKLVAHLNSMTFPAGWEEVLPVCLSPPHDGTVKGSQRFLGKAGGGVCNNYESGRRRWSKPPRVLRQWREKKKVPCAAAVHHVGSEEKET